LKTRDLPNGSGQAGGGEEHRPNRNLVKKEIEKFSSTTGKGATGEKKTQNGTTQRTAKLTGGGNRHLIQGEREVKKVYKKGKGGFSKENRLSPECSSFT